MISTHPTVTQWNIHQNSEIRRKRREDTQTQPSKIILVQLRQDQTIIFANQLSDEARSYLLNWGISKIFHKQADFHWHHCLALIIVQYLRPIYRQSLIFLTFLGRSIIPYLESPVFQWSLQVTIYIQFVFVCQFTTVCSMFNLIKCIVCDEINQYQIESPLVLYFKLETTPWTGSSE